MALAGPQAAPAVPKLDGSRNLIRQAWDLLSRLPGGKAVFSRLVGRMAPYTGTIHAQVTVLRAGYAEVAMADRRAVRNHLDCVHAIALANLAELAGNVALAYSLPDDARFIVSGMEIEYVKKARGTITRHRRGPGPADLGARRLRCPRDAARRERGGGRPGGPAQPRRAQAGVGRPTRART